VGPRNRVLQTMGHINVGTNSSELIYVARVQLQQQALGRELIGTGSLLTLHS
jgi:hypothetical protein